MGITLAQILGSELKPVRTVLTETEEISAQHTLDQEKTTLNMGKLGVAQPIARQSLKTKEHMMVRRERTLVQSVQQLEQSLTNTFFGPNTNTEY